MDKRFLRFVALVLVPCLAADPVTASALNSLAPPRERGGVRGIKIPARWGAITDSFGFRVSGSEFKRNSSNSKLETRNSKLVVLIQDLHGNVGVQRNIAEIIKYLNKRYGLRTVFVEGAKGPFDVSYIRNAPEQKLKCQAISQLLSQVRLNGAEVAAMESRVPLHLWGVDDQDLYVQNLQAFYQASGQSPVPHPRNKNWKAFYQIAEERNLPLTLQTLDHLNLLQRTAAPLTLATLVVGGYHTQGITQLFKTYHVPYLVVTPTVNHLGDERPYVTRLRNLAEEAKDNTVAIAAASAVYAFYPSDSQVTHAMAAQLLRVGVAVAFAALAFGFLRRWRHVQVPKFLLPSLIIGLSFPFFFNATADSSTQEMIPRLLLLVFLIILGFKIRIQTMTDTLTKRPKKQELIAGMQLCGMVVIAGVIVALLLLGVAFHLGVLDELMKTVEHTKTPHLPGLIGFFTMSILGPLTEELLFRGFLYHLLEGSTKKRRGHWIPTLLQALAFALIHPFSVPTFVFHFLDALLLQYVTNRYGTLWPAVLGHAGGNAIVFLNEAQMFPFSIALTSLVVLGGAFFTFRYGLFPKEIQKRRLTTVPISTAPQAKDVFDTEQHFNNLIREFKKIALAIGIISAPALQEARQAISEHREPWAIVKLWQVLEKRHDALMDQLEADLNFPGAYSVHDRLKAQGIGSFFEWEKMMVDREVTIPLAVAELGEGPYCPWMIWYRHILNDVKHDESGIYDVNDFIEKASRFVEVLNEQDFFVRAKSVSIWDRVIKDRSELVMSFKPLTWEKVNSVPRLLAFTDVVLKRTAARSDQGGELEAHSESIYRLKDKWKLLGIFSFAWVEETSHLLMAFGWKQGWEEIRKQKEGLYSGHVNLSQAPRWRQTLSLSLGFVVSLAVSGLSFFIAYLTGQGFELTWGDSLLYFVGGLTALRVLADLMLLLVSPEHELRQARQRHSERPSEITIEPYFSATKDTYTISLGQQSIGTLRFQVDHQSFRIVHLEMVPSFRGQDIELAVIQRLLCLAREWAGSRPFTVSILDVTDLSFLQLFLTHHLLDDLHMQGTVKEDGVNHPIVDLTPDQWTAQFSSRSLSDCILVVEGQLPMHPSAPVRTVREKDRWAVLQPNRSQMKFAQKAAPALIDFLNIGSSTLRKEMTENLVRNFRVCKKTFVQDALGFVIYDGYYTSYWKRFVVYKMRSRWLPLGRRGPFRELGTEFGSTFAHEAIHFLQHMYGIGYAPGEQEARIHTIPYAVAAYLRTIAQGPNLKEVVRVILSKLHALGSKGGAFDRGGEALTDETMSRLVPGDVPVPDGLFPGKTTTKSLADRAFAHYVRSGRWETGRDVITSYMLPAPDSVIASSEISNHTAHSPAASAKKGSPSGRKLVVPFIVGGLSIAVAYAGAGHSADTAEALVSNPLFAGFVASFGAIAWHGALAAGAFVVQGFRRRMELTGPALRHGIRAAA